MIGEDRKGKNPSVFRSENSNFPYCYLVIMDEINGISLEVSILDTE